MDTLLDDLTSDDLDTLRRGVERCADRLKKGDLDDSERGGIGAQLRALATHRSPKVRQGVAEAALHVADEHFEDIIPELLQDPNAFVKRTATRTFDERSKRRRAEQLRDEQGAHIERLLAKFEKDHTKEARKAADYLCERKTEFFVQKMHHELSKIATSLKAALVNIKAESKRPQIHRDHLAENADTAFAKYELLMAIVDSARSHTELVPPKFKHESLAAMVNEAIELLRDRIGDRAARLETIVRIDAGLTFDADRGALMQAFSNVLQNAVEACPAAGRSPIRVHVVAKPQKAGTQIGIVFTDNGAGIAKGALPHVAEPFCSSKPGGRGLGLFNVRKMVEAVHGGAFHLDSTPGEGTTVTMVLPRKQAKA